MEEQLQLLYGDFLVRGESEKDPKSSYEPGELVEYCTPDNEDTITWNDSNNWKLGKYFLRFIYDLLKASTRDTAPEWTIFEVPKMIYSDLNVILHESKFKATSEDVEYGWKGNEWTYLENKCRRSTTPLPDSVYYGAKWFFEFRDSDDILNIKDIFEVPDITAPERMKIGYFPSGCESDEDRMVYLMQRYQESRKECNKFNWKHRKNMCAAGYREQDADPRDLLFFHKMGRHLQGFFKFDRKNKTGEVFLVDIYNRHKFPWPETKWTTEQTEDFDKLNAFCENLSQFLRLNHDKINQKMGSPMDLNNLITSTFLVCNHPDEPEDCQENILDVSLNVCDNAEGGEELDDFQMNDEARDHQTSPSNAVRPESPTRGCDFENLDELEYQPVDHQPDTTNAVRTKRLGEECESEHLDHSENQPGDQPSTSDSNRAKRPREEQEPPNDLENQQGDLHSSVSDPVQTNRPGVKRDLNHIDDLEDQPGDQPSTSNSVRTKRPRAEREPLDVLEHVKPPPKKRAVRKKQKKRTRRDVDGMMQESHGPATDENDMIVAKPRNEPGTNNVVLVNQNNDAMEEQTGPKEPRVSILSKVRSKVPRVSLDLAKTFYTRMEVLEEAPGSIESDAIPLLILKMLNFHFVDPESVPIGSLLDMDTDLRNFVGPHRANLDLFRNMVRMECRLRRMMAQRGNGRESRERLEELSEIIEPYRQSVNFSKESVGKELEEANRSNEYTTDAWNFKESFLAAAYYLLESNQSVEPIVVRFDEIAARWKRLFGQDGESEDTPEDMVGNGNGSETDQLLEAVIKAKNACILQMNEVDRYSPEAVVYMEMAQTLLGRLKNQVEQEWAENRKANKRPGNRGKMQKLPQEVLKKQKELENIKDKVGVAKQANINRNSHVAAELLSILERSLCPDTPLPTFRQLGSPPQDICWSNALLLTRHNYEEFLKMHQNALQENFMKDGRMDWKKAREMVKENFISIKDLAQWDWQISSMSLLAIEFIEQTNEEDTYGMRLLDLIRSILYPLVTEWNHSDREQTERFREALVSFNSCVRQSRRPLDDGLRSKVKKVISDFGRLSDEFVKKRIVKVMKVAKAWEAQFSMIASYVGKPAIDNYCRGKKDFKSWHVTYASPVCDKQLDSMFLEKITLHLGPFVYAFWRSMALLVAAKDRKNILTMCAMLREVIEKEAADMKKDFCATLEALEECIRGFADSEDLFDPEVIAKLVRVGMEMLASNLAEDPENTKNKRVKMRDDLITIRFI